MNKYRVERLRKEVDGVAYISKYIYLKSVGSAFKARCPFHNEKTPSLTVYPPETISNGKKQGYTSFYCFGCGAGGDVIEFKKLKDNLENRDQACTELEIEYGLISDDDIALHSFLEEELNRMEYSFGKTLSPTEINLICSCICRNYLKIVKDEYPSNYEDEKNIIEKYYNHFDFAMLDYSELELQELIDDVKNKIKNRINNLKN